MASPAKPPASPAGNAFEQAILARYLDADLGEIQVGDKKMPVGGLTPANIEVLQTTYGIDPVNYMVHALAGDDTIEEDEASRFNDEYGQRFGVTIKADGWDHPYLRAIAKRVSDTSLTMTQRTALAEGFKRYDLGAIMMIEDEPGDPRDCRTVILKDLIAALADAEIYQLVSDMISRAGEAALPPLIAAASDGKDAVVRARAFAAAYRIVIQLDKPGTDALPLILRGLDSGFIAALDLSQYTPGFGFQRARLLEALAKYDPQIIADNPGVAAIVPALIDEAWQLESSAKRKKFEDVLLTLAPVSSPPLVAALADGNPPLKVDFAHDCLVRMLKGTGTAKNDALAQLSKRHNSPQDPGNGITHPTSYAIRFHSARVIMDSDLDRKGVAGLFPLVYWGLDPGRSAYAHERALGSLVLLARREGANSGSILYDAIVARLTEAYDALGGVGGEGGDPFCAKLGEALRTTIREPLAE